MVLLYGIITLHFFFFVFLSVGLMVAQAAPANKRKMPRVLLGLVYRPLLLSLWGSSWGTHWDQRSPEQMFSVRERWR